MTIPNAILCFAIGFAIGIAINAHAWPAIPLFVGAFILHARNVEETL